MVWVMIHRRNHPEPEHTRFAKPSPRLLQHCDAPRRRDPHNEGARPQSSRWVTDGSEIRPTS